MENKVLKQIMETDPPRLTILFRYDKDGSEQFQWGAVGTIPMMSVIGYIHRVQDTLLASQQEDGKLDLNPERYCEASALVMTWDVKKRRGVWFVNPDIPVDPLVGMLETIKAMLVAGRIAQHAAANIASIVGPDGRPVRGIEVK